MTESCEARPLLLENRQNSKNERQKDLMLEREKQVAFAALDQKEQRLAVFDVFDVLSLIEGLNYFFCFSAFASASSKIASTGFMSVHSTRLSMSR